MLSYFHKKDGAVAIEAAFVLPFMIMLGICTADAGYMLLQNHRIETQLSVAGRYLALSDSPQSLENAAKKLAVTGSIYGNSASKVDGWSVDDITIKYEKFSNTNGELYRGGDEINVVHLETSINYSGLGMLSLFFKDLSISSSYQERVV